MLLARDNQSRRYSGIAISWNEHPALRVMYIYMPLVLSTVAAGMFCQRRPLQILIRVQHHRFGRVMSKDPIVRTLVCASVDIDAIRKKNRSNYGASISPSDVW